MQQLTGTPSARPLLTQLQTLLRMRVQEVKDLLGFNVAAMAHLQRAAGNRQAWPAEQQQQEPAALAVRALLKRKAEASLGAA
jgi:hypothetical protein